MDANIFAKIKNDYKYLSRVEKKIADCILENPSVFIKLSMTELSKVSGVSQGSINNFSKKFCQDGFSALKLKIAASNSEKNEQPFSFIEKYQDVKAAMKVKIKENDVAFNRTYDINSEEELKKAVDLILAAEKIELFGLFRSGIVAYDFYFQLIQLGIPASYISDTLMWSVSASMLNEKDLLFVVSSSGKTKDVIDAVKIAKKNNVSIICLTADRFSPLAKISDVVLLAATSDFSISERSNEIVHNQFLIINTLCSYIRSITDVSGKKHYYKLVEILNSHSIED